MWIEYYYKTPYGPERGPGYFESDNERDALFNLKCWLHSAGTLTAYTVMSKPPEAYCQKQILDWMLRVQFAQEQVQKFEGLLNG